MATEESYGKSNKILIMNTLAFTVCFACWMLNGVLVTFLVDNGVFNWDTVQIGWLLGIPVLTGSVLRLPVGILTDKYGGRIVYGLLLLLSAIPMFLLSYAGDFTTFALCSLGFGITGTSFAVGIAYTSVWYRKEHQGTALGIFGAGNSGAAVTTLLAPTMLKHLTNNGANLDGWRTLPQIYAGALVVMAVVFFLFTEARLAEGQEGRTLWERLHPLKDIRVWRFGLYYFLVFGCFIGFSQWLVPYFVNVYNTSLVLAGLLAACFSFPSGVIRAFGGWVSDRYGARPVMYSVFWSSVLISVLLAMPRMEFFSPGRGVVATKSGVVTAVSADLVAVGAKQYPLIGKTSTVEELGDHTVLVWPTMHSWQEPVVKVGQEVQKKSLLAKGTTRIYFQANVWIYAFLVLLIGTIWGIGKAAVYKYIPDYFPSEVGVVGGMVGVLGGLGGFFCPVIFGHLLDWTGLWTSSWMFMLALSVACLVWMQVTVSAIMRKRAPGLMREIEARKVVCPLHGVEVDIQVKEGLRSTDQGAKILQSCSLIDEQGPQPCPPSCNALCLDRQEARQDAGSRS